MLWMLIFLEGARPPPRAVATNPTSHRCLVVPSEAMEDLLVGLGADQTSHNQGDQSEGPRSELQLGTHFDPASEAESDQSKDNRKIVTHFQLLYCVLYHTLCTNVKPRKTLILLAETSQCPPRPHSRPNDRTRNGVSAHVDRPTQEHNP